MAHFFAKSYDKAARKSEEQLAEKYRAGQITLSQYSTSLQGLSALVQKEGTMEGMAYISTRRRWLADEERRIREEQARQAADRERRAFLQRGGRMSTIYTGKGALQMLAPANRQTLGG